MTKGAGPRKANTYRAARRAAARAAGLIWKGANAIRGGCLRSNDGVWEGFWKKPAKERAEWMANGEREKARRRQNAERIAGKGAQQ